MVARTLLYRILLGWILLLAALLPITATPPASAAQDPATLSTLPAGLIDAFYAAAALDGSSLAYREQKVLVPGTAGSFFGLPVALDGDTVLVGVHVFRRTGTTWALEQRLAAADGEALDGFGRAVALDGDTALIGARYDNVGASTNQGSTYVFTRSGTTWTQQAKLTAADGAADDYFGSEVALDGDTALVGAPYDDVGANNDQGSAYVFTRSGTTWTQQANFTGADGAADDHFGSSVALDGDSALAGAVTDDVGANVNQGSAYVFVRSGTTWSQQAKLTAAEGAAYIQFGGSVALDGDTALIGARQDVVDGNSQGSAYVFTRSGSTWSQQAHLTAADGTADDWFGDSVALVGDTALIGASHDDVGANWNQGSAYVFTRSESTWTQQAHLTAPDGAYDDRLGESVALDGDTALVSASLDDIGANDHQGSAYLFAGAGAEWEFQAQLTSSDGNPDDSFGFSVGISGDTAVIGAPWRDGNTGAAYVFVNNGAFWAFQQKLTPSIPQVWAGFGLSVAIAGDTVLVGAPYQDISGQADQGAAFVFTRSDTTWSQQAVLTAAGGAESDHFSASIALAADGNTALIGSPDDDIVATGNQDQGSAYVFTRSGTTWSQQASLVAADGGVEDYFGQSVALDNNTALIGAPGDNIGASANRGSAYVFTRSGTTWTQQANLTGADGTMDDEFGTSVALSGDTALIGAPSDDVGSTLDQGSAYVFTRSGATWNQQANFVAADGTTGDQFGSGVALSGNTAVIGARFADLNLNSDQGSAYMFIRSGTTWAQRGRLTAVDGAEDDRFGWAVAFSGDTALVGAPRDTIDAFANQGSAYFFDVLNLDLVVDEDFDGGGTPPGWTQTDVNGTTGEWGINTVTVHPAGIPPLSPPNLSVFNSYTAAWGNSTRLWYSNPLDLRGYQQAELSFWMLHDPSYSTTQDRVQVQVSTDGGASWNDVGPAFYRYGAATGWSQKRIDLGAYLTSPDVRIGFLGISGYGNDCHIDSVQLLGFDFQLPNVTSMTRVYPALTNVYYLRYNVVFSEPVSGVGLTDFTPITSGAAIGRVESVEGSGANYTVTVIYDGADGALRLDIPATASIAGLHGLPLSNLPYTGPTYTIDRTNPLLLGITRTDPNPTSAPQVGFRIVFNEPVTGVGANDFLAYGVGPTGVSVSGVSGAGAVYTVTVNTGVGNGSLALGFPLSVSIDDLAGNYFGGGGGGPREEYTIQKGVMVFVPLMLRNYDANRSALTDPAGDWLPGAVQLASADIRAASIERRPTEGVLILTLQLNGNLPATLLANERNRWTWLLDTDRNAGTGDPWYDLGVEYEVNLHIQQDGFYVDVRDKDDTWTPVPDAGTIAGNTITVRLPVSYLGGATRCDWMTVVEPFDRVGERFDIAPNTGYASLP